jgi:23S rRNA (uracil1939-C5)-methyltransferase
MSQRPARKRHHRRKKPARALPVREVEASISSLGRQGDGVALLDGTSVHVPFSAPGDTAMLAVQGTKGRIVELLQPSTNRAEPACPHFGPAGDRCGGCALMHLEELYYHSWKQGIVRQALAREGLSDVKILPVLGSPLHTRRRAGFSVVGKGKDITVGFKEKNSHKTIRLKSCDVLNPALVELMHALPEYLRPLSQKFGALELTAHATLLENGIDIDLAGSLHEEELDLEARELLTAMAQQLDLPRLTLNEVPFFEQRAPVIIWHGTAVPLPPRAFLQATSHGEQVLQSLVRDAAVGARHMADLFAGCGTFTFALARDFSVHAVETVAPAITAIERARHTEGLKHISTDVRDLFEQPLMPKELEAFDTVVFDPPRAGAEAQARQLAASTVPRVLAVSCNPVSFARDARLLVEGGYQLSEAQPVDQFLFSPHIEVTALFTK